MTHEELRQLVEELVAAALANAKVSGSTVNNSVITNFCSSGIQDLATNCQVTILDQATVVENTLVAASAEVKGNLTVDGDLFLRGEIPADSSFYKDLVEHSAGLLKLSMDDQFFLQYAGKVIDQLKVSPTDVKSLSISGMPALSTGKLEDSITKSKLTELGTLNSLVVEGDSVLSNVTINGTLTLSNNGGFLVLQKFRKDAIIIGTTSVEKLVLSSNGKNNIVLEHDGSVSVQKLVIGAVEITSAGSMPTENSPIGSIAFNESGENLGWVSLGNGRWKVIS